VKDNSYYISTNRQRSSEKDNSETKNNYTYNYLKLLPKNKNASIVELGCSEGFGLQWLIDYGYTNIFGVDSDDYAIDVAKAALRTKTDEARILCSDALTYLTNCESESLDCVIMFNVIEHIPRESVIQILKEIHRTLKTNGCFIAQTGNWENPFNIGLFTRDFTHRVMYTKNSLKQVAIFSGFSPDKIIVCPVKYKTTLRNFPIQILSPIAGFAVKILARCMRSHIRETAALIYCHVRK
jgi:SAM-dependent methyltransferase